MAKEGDEHNNMAHVCSLLHLCIIIDLVQIFHYRVILIVALVVIPKNDHLVETELVLQDLAQIFHV